MATKTANVTARIQPNIKEQAEAILERLGIPVSVFIDMTYRQVIMRDGGLAQAKKNDSVSVDEAFNQLKVEI